MMEDEVLDSLKAFLKQISPVAIDTQNSLVAPEAKPTLYVGIDPGVTGSIALLYGKEAIHIIDIPVFRAATVRTRKLSDKDRKALGAKGMKLTEMPKTKAKKGTRAEFDLHMIARIFDLLDSSQLNLVVTLEKVPPKTSPGPLRFGDLTIYAAWAMWPLFLISRGYVLTEPRPQEWQAKFKLQGNAKERSRTEIQKLFPKAANWFARKKDHNRAEALFIALYGKRYREAL